MPGGMPPGVTPEMYQKMMKVTIFRVLVGERRNPAHFIVTGERMFVSVATSRARKEVRSEPTRMRLRGFVHGALRATAVIVLLPLAAISPRVLCAPPQSFFPNPSSTLHYVCRGCVSAGLYAHSRVHSSLQWNQGMRVFARPCVRLCACAREEK